MRYRAEPSGAHLTEADAAIVKRMLARADRQHDVAAWFGVNGGRIAEVASGRRFHWVQAEPENLPPPGPHPNGKQAAEAKQALDKALAALAEAESALLTFSRAAA